MLSLEGSSRLKNSLNGYLKNGIRSEATRVPGASRLRNQNEILIEKSDEAIKKTKSRNRHLRDFFCSKF